MNVAKLMNILTVSLALLLGASTELLAQTSFPDGGHFCVQSNNVYVAGQNLIELDLSSGKAITTILRDRLIQVGPIVEANALVYSVGGSYLTVNALDIHSKALLWTLDHRSSVISHHGGKVFLNNQLNDALEAVSASTGRKLWQSRHIRGSDFAFSFAFPTGDGRIVTNSGILSEVTGNVLKSWPRRILDASSSGGRVWILDDRGIVSELEATNELRWHSSAGYGLKGAKSIFAGGDLIFVLEKQQDTIATIVAISQTTHHIVWSHPIDADSYAGAVTISNGLVVAVSGGKVRAYDAKSGALQWSVKLQTRAASPIVTNGLILLKSAEGIYALRSKDGTVHWRFDERLSASPVGP